jgi:ribosomal subunit interface protein
MQVIVTGKQVQIRETLRQRIAEEVQQVVGKYFSRPLESHVTLAKDGRLFRSDLTLHLGPHLFIKSSANDDRVLGAFTLALEKADSRLRRYKGRLNDHHANKAPHDEVPEILSQLTKNLGESGAATNDAANHAAIVAEPNDPLATLTVADASMRLELEDLPIFLFNNSANGKLNVVYRRNDGHIGWFDPVSKVAAG